jgi:signal transduction histidine kinase
MSLRLFSRARPTAAWRISVWTTVAFSLCSAAAFVIMYLLVARDVQRRSDAWLLGEADVLTEVAANTPRDTLDTRLVQEVAELASHEVIEAEPSSDQPSQSVFFLLTRIGRDPVWVGPEPKALFMNALSGASGQPPDTPATFVVPGHPLPFRVVWDKGPDGSRLYLGFADTAANALMHRLVERSVLIWCAMALIGFAISAAGAFRTLQRVEQISETVARIGTEELGRRLPEPLADDEIARLSRTFNRMLERIQRSVYQIRVVTDSVAHDLKSPVTSIRGSLEVALLHGDSEDWRERVADAVEKLDRLSQTLNTALDLAEADAGALPLKLEPLDLGALVEHLSDLFQPSIADRQHKLRCQVQPGLLIEGDPSLLSRTIANLLDNEVAHLPQGCQISVTVRQSEHYAELILEDDGPGFPEELRARAFERFVKGQQSSGHGLGLAFVHAIVQAHGGCVKIGDSSSGGAQIRIKLPLVRVPA